MHVSACSRTQSTCMLRRCRAIQFYTEQRCHKLQHVAFFEVIVCGFMSYHVVHKAYTHCL